MQSLVKVDKPIPNAFDATEITYRLQLKDGDPKEVFPQDNRQSLRRNDAGEWLLTIRSIDPAAPADDGPPPDLAEFLRPNNWLQSDNPRVVLAAKQAVGDASDPWEKARLIERWVHDNIKAKNFTKAFDTAAVVAERLEGDCTEHGVLLSAMARAAGVPSRVAVGLVYADRLGGFAYHMWSEVHVNGRWVPLDGTLGRGHASPAHIKLSDSSLDGVDATATMLPVVRVMGGLKMSVVSWKHAESK
jgi:transglutaminase-like putative cysteine protease